MRGESRGQADGNRTPLSLASGHAGRQIRTSYRPESHNTRNLRVTRRLSGERRTVPWATFSGQQHRGLGAGHLPVPKGTFLLQPHIDECNKVGLSRQSGSSRILREEDSAKRCRGIPAVIIPRKWAGLKTMSIARALSSFWRIQGKANLLSHVQAVWVLQVRIEFSDF